MPLFQVELNRVADDIGASTLTIRLHTAAPTNASPMNGRTTVGGAAYENGASLTAANISNAANGDISNSAAIPFGTADEDVGTVTHWSAYRGSAPVAFGTLPITIIENGDSFSINSGTLQINGSTS